MSKRKAKTTNVPAIIETAAETVTQNMVETATIETEGVIFSGPLDHLTNDELEAELDALSSQSDEPSESITDEEPVPTEIEEIDEALNELDLGDETNSEDTGETVQESEAQDQEMPTLDEVFASFDDETVTKTTHEISQALTERENHELKYGDPNIQNVLKSARRGLVSKRAAKVFLAAHVDPDFINQSRSGAARYNAKGLLKIADIVKALTDGEIHNAVNIACMKSLFAFRRAGEPYTAEVAKASVSDKIRIADAKIKALLVRHTVSQSTASTQASSTMNALVTLGVVRAEGSRNKPTYHLVDNPLTRQLEQVLFPKSAQEEEQEDIAA